MAAYFAGHLPSMECPSVESVTTSDCSAIEPAASAQSLLLPALASCTNRRLDVSGSNVLKAACINLGRRSWASIDLVMTSSPSLKDFRSSIIAENFFQSRTAQRIRFNIPRPSEGFVKDLRNIECAAANRTGRIMSVRPTSGCSSWVWVIGSSP